MTRIHDMGGRFGDGPVVPEPETDPVFHDDWHARACALTLACGTLGAWNIDISRHARESLAPTDYARFSYYEKWLAGLANLLVARGVLTRDDLSTEPDGSEPLRDTVLRAADVAAVLARGGPAERPCDTAPRFAVGDAVRSRRLPENRLVAGGHTRLPDYASGALGRVVRLHGAHVLPDSNAHDLGEAPEPLYAVAFAASELWAFPEHPRDEVIVDLWDSYLEPA